MTPQRVARNPARVLGPNPDPRNGKRDAKYVAALAKDILTRGLRNPPYIREVDGVSTIVTGEHRRLAMLHLGWTEADFYLLEGELTAAQAAMEQLQESLLHTRFSPLQKLAAIRTVMETEKLTRGQFVEKYGDLLGVDEAGLSKLFRVDTICPHLRAKVESGELGLSFSYLLATVPDACTQASEPCCKQQEFAAKCLTGVWTRDALEGRVREFLKGTGKPKKQPPTTLKAGGLVCEYRAEAPVEEFLAEVAGLVEKVRKCSKKGDKVEDLVFLLKRG